MYQIQLQMWKNTPNDFWTMRYGTDDFRLRCRRLLKYSTDDRTKPYITAKNGNSREKIISKREKTVLTGLSWRP